MNLETASRTVHYRALDHVALAQRAVEMERRLAAAEAVVEAARAIDREGGDLPHLNAALSETLAAYDAERV